MAKYVYPAIFTPEDEGGYSVLFPDLEGCYTQGDDLPDALYMAKDVLEFVLYRYEKEKIFIPAPSDIKTMNVKDTDFVSFVAGDTINYFKKHNAKTIKKTLSIPEWLNTAAEKEHVNFSGILQDALIEHLNLN